MAWTDTTLCSFCGKEIPIFRKFGNGQFCSKQHAEEYQKQQEMMAVDLLHRTHDALKAYRPVGSSIEDILGTGAAKQAPPPPLFPPTPVATQQLPPPITASYQAPAPVYQAPPAPVAHVTRDDSREFDMASPAVFARLAGTPEPPPAVAPKPAASPKPAAPAQRELSQKPIDSAMFHVGDTVNRMSSKSRRSRPSLSSQLMRMLSQLWPFGTQKA